MFSKVPQELTFTATLSKSNLVHQWASSPTIRIKNAISRISHTILLLSETTNEQRRLNYRYYPQNRPIIYERKSHYSNVKLESLREPCNSKEKKLQPILNSSLHFSMVRLFGNTQLSFQSLHHSWPLPDLDNNIANSKLQQPFHQYVTHTHRAYLILSIRI